MHYKPTIHELQQHFDKIKQSRVFNRASTLCKLLAFLVEKEIQQLQSGGDKKLHVKEIEVAIEVFGKTSDFNSAEDASIRVHMSRLRKKLQQYYAVEGQQEKWQLTVPVGEYKLVHQTLSNETKSPQLLGSSSPKNRVMLSKQAASGIILAVMISIFLLLETMSSEHTKQFTLEVATEKSTTLPLWQQIQSPAFNNVIVLGSPSKSRNNESASANLGLMQVLKNILSVSGRFRYTPIINASELTMSELKESNVIFIGHYSELGILQRYFAASDYELVSNGNSIYNRLTDNVYSAPTNTQQPYADFGLFAKFSGPRNNKIYLLTAYTESALLWMSWYLTDVKGHAALPFNQNDQNSLHDNIELFFKVPSINGQDIDAELISQRPIQAQGIWRNF